MKKLFIIAGVSIIGLGVVKAQQGKVNTINQSEQEVQRKAAKHRGHSSKEVHPELKTQVMKEELNLDDQQTRKLSVILEEKQSSNTKGNRAVQEKLNQERKAVLNPDQIKVIEHKAEARRMEAAKAPQLERAPSNDENRAERHKMLKERN